MIKVFFMLVLLASVAFAESVRETETWMPPKAGDSHNDLESSGDFIFPNEDSIAVDDEDDGTESYDDLSGSGDEWLENEDSLDSKLKEFDNHIPDIESAVQPQPKDDDELHLVRQNEVAHPPSIQLSHAGEQNIFNKAEVLAAVIAGGAVGLLFAVLLILLLVYHLKKKDEGSYDLGKKPIYKKAPTTEIYA